MIYNIYSVYDSVGKLYTLPFFERSENTAIANFKNVCQNPESLLAQFPESYTLNLIGTFDDEDGFFNNQPIGTNNLICKASDFVIKEKNSANNS